MPRLLQAKGTRRLSPQRWHWATVPRRRVGRRPHVHPAAAIELRQFIAEQFGRDTEFFKELENQSKKDPVTATPQSASPAL